jgi:Cytochrome P460
MRLPVRACACGLLALTVAAGAGCTASSNHVAAEVGGSAGETQVGEIGDTAAGGSVAAAIADYQTWKRRTAEPVPLAADIFGLCRSPSLAERQFLDSEHGIDQRLVLDWLNPGADTAYEHKANLPFPVGAAIVKEKLVRETTGTLALVARGVMIKREPGFDAAHGDWEFAYWEPTAGLLAGPTESKHCGDCHLGAQPTDFVFFDQAWRRP